MTVDKPGWFSGVVETKTDNKETDSGKKIEKIGFFQNIWNSIKGFFINLRSFGKKPTNTPTPTVKITVTPSPTPTIKLTPTPMAGINKDAQITVFNSGAPAGYAKKYTDLIKAAGYSLVTAGNANTNLKNALITYPERFKLDVSIIENILKAEYKNIVKTLNATGSGIVVNLGTL